MNYKSIFLQLITFIIVSNLIFGQYSDYETNALWTNWETAIEKTTYANNTGPNFDTELYLDFMDYTNSASTRIIVHSIYSIDLPELPEGSYISGAKLVYETNNGSLNDEVTFKMVHVSGFSDNLSRKEKWELVDRSESIGNFSDGSGEPQTEEIYGGFDKIVETAYNNNKTKVYFGFKPMTQFDESNYRAVRLTELRIILKYNIVYNITVDNNFTDENGNHGILKIDGSNISVPTTINRYKDESLELEAISNQTDSDGYPRVWHTGDINKSRWTKRHEGEPVVLSNRFSNPLNFIVTEEDNNSDYTANLLQVKATTNGTMSETEYWVTPITLQGNVYVPSGVTLNVTADASLDFNGYGLVSTGGTINYNLPFNGIKIKESSSTKGYFEEIQPAINAASADQTVEIPSGTFSGNLSLTSDDDVTVKGAGQSSTTINGDITITNSDDATIKDLSMSTNSDITINGGYRSTVNNVSFNNSSYPHYAKVYDGASTVLASYQIIGSSTGSGITLYNTNTSNLYWITLEGYDFGLQSTSGAQISVSESQFCDNMFDLWGNGGSIYANHVTLSSTSSTYGNVSLGYIDGYCNQRMSKAGSDVVNSDNNKQSKELKTANKEFDKYLKANRKNKLVSDEDKALINDVVSLYKVVVSRIPSEDDFAEALSKLDHCYRIMEKEKEFDNYLNNLLSKKINSDYSKDIERHIAKRLVKEGKVDEALVKYDELLAKKNIKKKLEVEMLYEKAVALKYYKKDEEAAQKVFMKLFKKDKDGILAKFAFDELTDENKENVTKEVEEQIENFEESTEFRSSAYPNPFNPTTTIKFNIPENQKVRIQVFNMLGQKVTELTNQVYSAGTHKVHFDAGNLSSGIYYYTVEAGSKMMTKKITLVK